MIALMAVFMTVTVQADDPDWKQSPTGLTVSAGDQAGEIDITWDPESQTSKTLSDYRVTWTPDGEGFKTNDQTDWYAYPTTNQVTVTGLDAGATHQVRVRARYNDNIFVERLWRTVKYEEVYLKAYANATDARKELSHYFRFYNDQSPHQALGYRTPAEVLHEARNATGDSSKVTEGPPDGCWYH